MTGQLLDFGHLVEIIPTMLSVPLMTQRRAMDYDERFDRACQDVGSGVTARGITMSNRWRGKIQRALQVQCPKRCQL